MSIQLPEKFPFLKLTLILLGVYTVFWISLEGGLLRVVWMGVGVTAVSTLHLLQKQFGGRTLQAKWWVGVTAVSGTISGLLSVGTTLIFMIVKTGLHAHGPEFTPSEIEWVIQQWSLWGTVGLLCGSAIGFISAGRESR